MSPLTALILFILPILTLTHPTISPKLTTRTTAPPDCITVDQHSSNSTYTTITAAIDSLDADSSSACIYIAAGTYEEQLVIKYRGKLTIYGETNDTTTYAQNTVTITHTISSPEAGSLVKSATLAAESDGLSIYNVNVVNGFGAGAQAVALSANGNEMAFYACQFISYQDTLYAKDGTQYYKNCYIEGAVDYIFGAASAYLSTCTVISTGKGFVTAMSRQEESDPAWYAFDGCTVSAAPGLEDELAGKVYLGRPWRVLARVIYQHCQLGGIIHAEGWTTMAEGATPLYYEWENTGEGADTAARKWESQIEGEVSKETVLGVGWEEWVDGEFV
ncbi:putative pectin methylesterase [Aspergillus steynii IBT 23096]|uniref:Pectinesterase n=1 Tax=Aspergillus steynii IBT 23096 TaxID=1392250 RepID=A0A2I2G909_9EURO|nr:putative pectin methylesterase [Aspergillus steynii IBT 23096]PLB49376.1 putative pectin methylesterase [Aspergillus steynii IBT 23096]